MTERGVIKHFRTLIAALSLTVAFAAQSAVPISSEVLLGHLQSRNFALLDDQLHELQRQYEAGYDREREIWEQFVVFGLPRARTEDIEAWLEASPASYAAHLAAGRHYYILGWHARFTAERAKDTAARARDARKHYEKSLEYVTKSLRLTAKPVVSYGYIVNLSVHLPDRISAQEYVEQCLTIDPRSFTIRQARLYTLQPGWGGSFSAMDELLAQAAASQLSPDKLRRLHATRYAYAGLDAEQYGRLGKALEDLDRSIDLDEIAWALVARGRILMRRGEMQLAKKSFDRAVALDPLDVYVYNNLAHWYWQNGDKNQALEAFKRSAWNGNDWSANQVARLIFSDVDGFKPNPREALDWWLLGANLGNAEAMLSVGECYRAGDCGSPADYARAEFWFRKGSEYGDERATVGLASMYWEGVGVPRNEEYAIELWLQAAHSPDPEVRRAIFRNLAHLLDFRRGVQAILQASGYPTLAGAMLLVMVLMPIAALIIGWSVGAVVLARPRTEDGNNTVILPKRGYWVFVWGTPALTGMLLWIGYGLGIIAEFIAVLAVFATVSAPSVFGLMRLADGTHRVDIDATGMGFAAAGRRPRVPWSEVVFAKRNTNQIVIGLRSKTTYVLDDRPFGDHLWKAISARVPASSLQSDAHVQMPGFKEQSEIARKAFDVTMIARASLFVHCTLWVGFLGFGSAALGCVWWLGAGELSTEIAYRLTWGILGFFSALSLYGIASTGDLIFSSKRVVYRTLLGTYAMDWSQIADASTDDQANALVFRGNGMRLVALGPALWSSSDRSKIYPALLAYLAHRGISVGKDSFAAFKISTGCRLSSESVPQP